MCVPQRASNTASWLAAATSSSEKRGGSAGRLSASWISLRTAASLRSNVFALSPVFSPSRCRSSSLAAISSSTERMMATFFLASEWASRSEPSDAAAPSCSACVSV